MGGVRVVSNKPTPRLGYPHFGPLGAPGGGNFSWWVQRCEGLGVPLRLVRWHALDVGWLPGAFCDASGRGERVSACLYSYRFLTGKCVDHLPHTNLGVELLHIPRLPADLGSAQVAGRCRAWSLLLVGGGGILLRFPLVPLALSQDQNEAAALFVRQLSPVCGIGGHRVAGSCTESSPM